MIEKLLYEFDIPGKPTGKGRPRVTKWGTHNTEQTINYENWVKTCFMRLLDDHNKELAPFDGYISVELIVFYPLLKSMSKKDKAKAIDNMLRPDKKPDCDNIAKIILDSLNGLAYKDDKQIVNLSVSKYYGDPARVNVVINELTLDKLPFEE